MRYAKWVILAWLILIMTLKRTTVEELSGICMSMKSGNAPGYDDISMYVIKNTFELVSDGTS